MSLTTLPIFFLDLQTTGSKPENAFILEMAFGTTSSDVQNFLVEQPSGMEIPRRIQMITGIKEKDMEEALPFPEAMRRLLHFVKPLSSHKDAVCVIHFAQFEKPFLKAAFEAISADMPFTIICTHDIAKRLLPNLPTRGIKGLAGYFGYDAGELKRAASHVEATKAIWAQMVKALEEKNISSLEELQNWLIETPKAARSKYEYPLPKEKRLKLPDVPGIYRMLNFKGEVLYVGKATSLKSRVNSYFRGQKNRDAKKLEMLTQVWDVKVTPCETPLEAALMETDEIKRLNPRYNIALKKGHRALVFFDRDFITTSHTCDDVHYIGPFSNSLVFESTMSLSQYLRLSLEETALPDPNTFFEELDPQFIKDGLDLFCERHNFIPEMFASMRSIIAVGIIWQRRKKNEAVLEEELEIKEIEKASVENEVEEINDLMTVEDLADKIERHFMRAGRAYLRARKINRMLNVDVEFEMENHAARRLFVRNGHIQQEESRVISDGTWPEHSIETYDRMTVLLSELERVKMNNGHYHLSFIQ
jgi:DNA polymerase-3 subunit epsilon